MKKRGRGRPPKGEDALTEGIEIRFTKASRQRVTLAAELDGVALSVYVREAAEEKAERRLAAVGKKR